MKISNLIIVISLISLFSCKKEEGEGGRSSIKGKIHMTDKTGSVQGDYDVPDYDVYIIYGTENDIYDDDMKTNYDGTFEFKNLREGSYKIYTYTANSTVTSGVSPVFVSTTIEKNEGKDIGTIEVEK